MLQTTTIAVVSRYLFPILFLALFAFDLQAVDRMEIQLGRISGEGISAEAVTLNVQWLEGESAVFTIEGNSLQHPLLPFPLEQPFRLQCKRGSLDDQEIRCDEGRGSIGHPALARQDFDIIFNFNKVTHHIELSINNMMLKQGSLRLDAHADQGRWQAHITGEQVGMASAGLLLKDALPWLGGHTLGGQAAVQAELEGGEQGVEKASWKVSLHKGAISEPAGDYLAEGLKGTWSGNAERNGERRWQGRQRIRLTDGALLTPYFYLAPDGHPISADFGFSYHASERRLGISNLNYLHEQVLALSLTANWMLEQEDKLQQLKLNTETVKLPQLYRNYLQPVLAGTLLEEVELYGEAKLQIERAAKGNYRAELVLKDAYLEEGKRRFAFYGVNGRLISTRGRPAETSRLSWDGGHLLERMEYGKIDARLRLENGGLRLLQPIQLPVLDGNLAIESLELQRKQEGPEVTFQGAVNGISMNAFSQAVGWPLLAGQLSGSVPRVSYQNGNLQVDGEMRVQVFDGEVRVKDLHLDDLFGVLPRARADLELRNLDLETLTRTFSFGKITGQLGGYIRDLNLEGWKSVSFDARLETPEGDESAHRISQRAVDNISNLGGAGLSGAISRAFIRVLDEFRYARLGISCRLKNGVCEMGGIGPAKGGYYIVKGGGIPRIDIIGFNQQIDWDTLVAKMQEIAQQPEPVIQ